MIAKITQKEFAKEPAGDVERGRALMSQVEHQSYRNYRSQDKIAE